MNIKKFFYLYSIRDIKCMIFNSLSQEHNINKNKLFQLINKENNCPSKEIRQFTMHYNIIIHLINIMIISTIILFFVLNDIKFVIIGLIYCAILICYKYYLNKYYQYIIETFKKQLL